MLPAVADVSVWAVRVTLAQAMLLLVGYSNARPEYAWVGDSNSFCHLSNDLQARSGVEQGPHPSRRQVKNNRK